MDRSENWGTEKQRADRQTAADREELFLMGWNKFSPFFRDRERNASGNGRDTSSIEESICQWRSGQKGIEKEPVAGWYTHLPLAIARSTKEGKKKSPRIEEGRKKKLDNNKSVSLYGSYSPLL